MNETSRGLLRWTPRVLCLAFAGFLAMFAMDVFGLPLDLPHKLLALFMHLIPTWVVLLVLALAWRRPWIAAVGFPLLAVAHLVWKWGLLHWSGYAILDGPMLLMGLLFWLDWRARAKPEMRTR